MYTIEDVSKLTGLSISIISRYLNGYNVRKENKKLIDEAIKKTGYTPNEFARGLRARHTKSVGVIIPKLTDVFALEVISNLEKELKKEGYGILVANCMNDRNNELSCVKTMLQKRVDAIVMLPFGEISGINAIMSKANVPLIVFDQYFKELNADYVLFENKESAKRACDILIENGHRNIAIVLGPLTDYTPRQRLKGFRKSLESNGIPIVDENIYEAEDYSLESGYKFLNDIMKRADKPTAIFSTSYDLTVGVFKGVYELGLKIPDDISIMAFDSLPLYDLIMPKLWTVVQPIEEYGKQLARQVLTRVVNCVERPYTTYFIGYDIREGQSIKNLKL